jgi:hypothetical protein
VKDEKERPEVTYALRSLDRRIAWLSQPAERPPKRGEVTNPMRPLVAALKEARALLVEQLSGCIILPGWRCRAPGCFGWMGEEKESLTHCRVCGAPREEA